MTRFLDQWLFAFPGVCAVALAALACGWWG